MKHLFCLTLLATLLTVALSPSFAADAPSVTTDYRETPKPLRLFLDQWSTYPPPPTAYTLDFLRTADEETANMTLGEAVLIGLKNNPGIEVDRLEPFRAA